MNLPNKLTVLRVLIIPFFVFFLLRDEGRLGWQGITAAILFVLASATDWLDGYFARKPGLITNFGKFMDPLADKLLVSAALICFVAMNRLEAWVVILIISREFIISGFRLVASDQGIVIAAGFWGKAKTTIQMGTLVLLLLPHPRTEWLTRGMIYLMVLLTVISLFDYILNNRSVLTEHNH